MFKSILFSAVLSASSANLIRKSQRHVNLVPRSKTAPALPRLYLSVLRNTTATNATAETNSTATNETANATNGLAPKAKYNAEAMPKTPTAINAILNLSMQYFMIYTLLYLFRLFSQPALAKLAESASQTVNYAPMLSVLFIAVRLRADQLTQGRTEEFVLPTVETQSCMQFAAWAVLAQLVLVLIVPVLTGELNVPVDAEGNVDVEAVGGAALKSGWKATAAKVLSIVRYAVLASLYGCTVMVVVGMWKMEAPKEIFPDGTPPVSPAIKATINLTTQFFVVYFLLALVRTYVSFKGPSQSINKLGGALQLAAYTLNFAPMIAILCIAARLRALMINPISGAPQPWAQSCFDLCAYSILLQTLMAVGLPFASSNIKCIRGDFEGDVKLTGVNGVFAYFLIAVRYAAILALYGGFSAICWSILTIADPKSGQVPSLSPTMLCLLLLTFQYFGIYLVTFVTQSVKQLTQGTGALAEPASKASGPDFLNKLSTTMENARSTVMFAPMLSCLFIGARMRAIQLSRTVDDHVPKGAGPGQKTQDGMYLSTWAVFLQLICVLFSGLSGSSDDSSAPSLNRGMNIACAFQGLKFFSMVAMYVGIIGVVYGVAEMTPETVKPYAGLGGLVPGLEVPAPVGADDSG